AGKAQVQRGAEAVAGLDGYGSDSDHECAGARGRREVGGGCACACIAAGGVQRTAGPAAPAIEGVPLRDPVLQRGFATGESGSRAGSTRAVRVLDVASGGAAVQLPGAGG